MQLPATRASHPRSEVPVMSGFVQMKYLEANDTSVMYEGPVKCILQGKGKMWYKDGRLYEGEFKLGCKNGNGVLACKNGNGVLTFKNGKKCDGLFRNDKFIAGTIIGKNADGQDYEYKGDVQNNVPHGSGVGRRKDKKGNWVTWTGKFKNNEFVSGTCDDGVTKRVGDFDKGSIQGNGLVEKKDGRKWNGIWENGFLIDGTYNGLECEDKTSDRKWGFLDCKISSQIINLKSDTRTFHKITIVSGDLKGKLCLIKLEWITAFSDKEKSGDDNVNGYWKMNTIFHEEDEFEEALQKISGTKFIKLNSVGAKKNENELCEDSKKRKRDEDNMDDVWKFVCELAQQKNDE